MERLNEFIKRGAAEVLLLTICCITIKIGCENSGRLICKG